ncbi:translation initiation factor eIF2B subunit alpha-like [Styela clava]
MNDEEISEYFLSELRNSTQSSPAVAAIKTLIEYLRKDHAETLSGLRDNLKSAIEVLVRTDCTGITPILSGSELFLRFITLSSLEHSDFDKVKDILISRGEMFLQKISSSRQKIARLGLPFLNDGIKVLVHSYSRVVLNMLIKAMEAQKRFTVFVTESRPDMSGNIMAEKLREHGIPVTVILDSAAGYVMEKIDLVLIGAEGVVENGGIMNKIGSYQIAVCAKAHNKPLYVAAESIKFVRLYPLNQQDVPNEIKYKASTIKSKNLDQEHPNVDYTPPSYITLLITDLGVLTPSAVSDELIKLYL